MKEVNGHLIYEPKDPHPKWHKEGHCPICDGGLGICSKCGKAEIELGQPCNKKENEQQLFTVRITRKEFLKLPIETRRRIISEQAALLCEKLDAEDGYKMME